MEQVKEALVDAADDATIADGDVDNVWGLASKLLEKLDRDAFFAFNGHGVVGGVTIDATEVLCVFDREKEGIVIGALDWDDGGSVKDALH